MSAGATDLQRDLAQLYATARAARDVRALIRGEGAVLAGGIVEAHLIGVRLALTEMIGARAAYETIQRAADAAADALIADARR